MKRLLTIIAVPVVALCFSVTAPLAAQGRGRGGGGGMGPTERPMPGPPGGASQSRGGSEARAQGRGGHGSGESSVSDRLADNTRLSSKVESLLPSGTKLSDAAKGFKNLGQFVAAVHVSHNLNIPFDQLKQEILAKGSLGKAIHVLKPDLSKKTAKEEVDRADKEAKQDIKNSEGKTAKGETGESSKTEQ